MTSIHYLRGLNKEQLNWCMKWLDDILTYISYKERTIHGYVIYDFEALCDDKVWDFFLGIYKKKWEWMYV